MRTICQCALLVLSVCSFACAPNIVARAGRPSHQEDPIPPWLSKLSRNMVVLTTTFEGDGYDPTQSGAGIIIGISASEVTVLTARHLLFQPQTQVAMIRARFSSVSPVDLTRPPAASFTQLRGDLATITIPVSEAVSTSLRAALAPIQVDSVAAAPDGNNNAWYVGRCGRETLVSFSIETLAESQSGGAAFEVRGRKLPPGCSGGAIFVEGRLVGVMQSTSSDNGLATSVETVPGQLRDFLPGNADNRSLLEPFGTLVFDDPPYRASYQLENGPTLALMPRNIVPTGKITLSIRTEGSDEIAEGQIAIRANQELKCAAGFATPISRFRNRYRYYMLGGGAAVLAVGLGFLGLAALAQDDFNETWSREARDRNHLYSNLALGTMIGGAAAVVASGAFAFLGDAREDSALTCK